MAWVAWVEVVAFGSHSSRPMVGQEVVVGEERHVQKGDEEAGKAVV